MALHSLPSAGRDLNARMPGLSHHNRMGAPARRQRNTGSCIHPPAAMQQQQQQSADNGLAERPTHRRGILQGLLGTAAMTISPPSAGAVQQAPAPGPDQAQPAASGSSIDPQILDDCGSSASSGPSSSCCQSRGAAAARDPAINSGCATPASVRQQQQISGLIPPRQVNLEVEVLRARAALNTCSTPLDKHRLLVTLKETNQAAFYALLQQDTEELLPLVYTPTIGDACLAWGTLLPRPTGLYVSTADRGRVQQVLQHWPSDEVRLAVITDGERILGLGDLGAHGMGIPTGKCVVYGAAGADPSWLLPITVDVGTDNKALRTDPLYIGQPVPRLRGPGYAELMMEVVSGLQVRFGRAVVVHWEDLAGANARHMLELVRQTGTIPTFNDDIQATAAVALAAVLGGVRVAGVAPLTQQRWLFFGAGQANLGAARLLMKALQQQGMSAAAARARIWMVDSKGLILNTRQNLTPEKAEFAQNPNNLPGGITAAAALGLLQSSGSSRHSSSSGSSSSSSRESRNVVQQLADTVAVVQPTALIGAAAVPGAFGQPVIEAIVQSVRAAGGPSARPLVLALSNPTSKAEVSYEAAMNWSGGSVVYASGSPFPPLAVAGSSSSSSSNSSSSSGGSSSRPDVLVPGQANNCLVFPGLGLGVVQSGATDVTDELLLAAAQAVAGMVTPEELQQERVLPRIGRLQEVAQAVAVAVAHAARVNGLVPPPLVA